MGDIHNNLMENPSSITTYVNPTPNNCESEPLGAYLFAANEPKCQISRSQMGFPTPMKLINTNKLRIFIPHPVARSQL